MRIGIDAKWFYSGHPSGRVFTRNLLRCLGSDFPDHQFVLFLKSRDRIYTYPFPAPNVQLCFGSLGINLVSNCILLPHLIKKHNIDIFVSQNFAVPLRTIPQVSVIFDIIFDSNPQFFTARERAYFAFIKPLLLFTDGIITISEQSKRELEYYGYTSRDRSAYVVSLGVDDKFIKAREFSSDAIVEFKKRLNLPAEFILYVGRFNARKNIEGLIQTYARLDRSRWKLVLCGREDGRGTRVRDLIADLGLLADVQILNQLTDDDLPLLYRSATAFAYFSFREGFGLPPLEAMACGTPVIVSNTPSIREVCGTAVEYVDPENPQDMLGGLDRVLSSASRRAEMSTQGYERASLLTWGSTAEQFMRVVERIGRRP